MREVNFIASTPDGTEINVTLTKKEFETSISLLNKLSIVLTNSPVPSYINEGKFLGKTADFLQEVLEEEFNLKERENK